ncbi:MAG: hypothetical protein WBE26_08825 [Phycisphaerae bacterium]
MKRLRFSPYQRDEHRDCLARVNRLAVGIANRLVPSRDGHHTARVLGAWLFVRTRVLVMMIRLWPVVALVMQSPRNAQRARRGQAPDD